MNNAHRRLAAVFGALALTAPCALGDIVYLSKGWAATGSGRLVDPGFPDMTGSYSESGDDSANRSLLTLRNHPDFSSDHNWLNQTINADMDEPTILPALFHVGTRGTANLNGAGVAVDGESVLTAHATVLITGTPAPFAYMVRATGAGIMQGVCERTARIVLAPQGGPPILDEMVSSSFEDRDIRGSTSFVDLAPGTYDILIELTYQVHQAGVTDRFESVASAEILWAIPAPGAASLLALATLAAARRKR